mmetsp:Transcript_23490/g.63185  ORF Transcript_23490/g.63185 Transcript_23490/m.63185 type:complete len:256 (+) Transcript_23490:556-1323(+)
MVLVRRPVFGPDGHSGSLRVVPRHGVLGVARSVDPLEPELLQHAVLVLLARQHLDVLHGRPEAPPARRHGAWLLQLLLRPVERAPLLPRALARVGEVVVRDLAELVQQQERRGHEVGLDLGERPGLVGGAVLAALPQQLVHLLPQTGQLLRTQLADEPLRQLLELERRGRVEGGKPPLQALVPLRVVPLHGLPHRVEQNLLGLVEFGGPEVQLLRARNDFVVGHLEHPPECGENDLEESARVDLRMAQERYERVE